MDPSITLQIFLNGLTMGAVYGLMAVGLTLIFGILDIVNSAHGAFYMLGAYLTYLFYTWGVNLYISVFLSILSIFFLSMIVYRLSIHPIVHLHVNVLILTFALAIFLEQVVLLTFGPFYRNIPGFVSGELELLGASISYQRVLAGLTAFIVVFMLSYLIKNTKTGKAIRMVAQDKEAALILGINVNRIYLLTFGVGCARVAFSASLLSPLFTVHPAMGWVPFLISFFIVICGGLGSISGALIVGVIFGLADSITSYLIAPGWGLIASFAATIIVLLLKPSGLMGKKT